MSSFFLSRRLFGYFVPAFFVPWLFFVPLPPFELVGFGRGRWCEPKMFGVFNKFRSVTPSCSRDARYGPRGVMLHTLGQMVDSCCVCAEVKTGSVFCFDEVQPAVPDVSQMH